MSTQESATPTTEVPRSWRTWRWTLSNYLFILPFMILFLVFILGPIFYSLFMSFTRWEILALDHPFIGLDNYKELLNDDLWWLTLRNTLYMGGLTAFLNTIFAFFVALAVDQPIRGRHLFRVIFYSPVVLSVSVMGIVMGWIFNTQFGVLNYFVAWIGLPTIPWLSDPNWVIPSLSLATVWWTFGYPMLVYLAGLQSIPKSLYEAARIDGAGPWKTIWHITVPLMRPTILFVAVTQLISHLQIFGQPYIMTGGGPGRASFTIIQYLYQTAWRFFRMGYGSTIAIALAIIILIFTLLQFRFIGRGSAVEY